LGIAPDEIRLRNYIRPEEFPYTTPNGCVYDSGNYPKMLQLAKERIGWEDWKKKQAAARAEGRWMGIGIGTTLDSGTNNFGQSQIVNPNAPFSPGILRAQTASWISMARLSSLSALVRKARVTKLPQRKLSPMFSTSTRTSLPCAQDSTPSETFIPGLRAHMRVNLRSRVCPPYTARRRN
jgi:hypothetical protein